MAYLKAQKWCQVMTTHLPIKNRTYSKAGVTLTCPGCGKQSTYQIGQFDYDAWLKHRDKWWCAECVSKWHPVYIPTFHPAYAVAEERVKAEEEKATLDKLMEMI